MNQETVIVCLNIIEVAETWIGCTEKVGNVLDALS